MVRSEWIQNVFWRWTISIGLADGLDEGSEGKRGTGELKLNLLCVSKKLM